MKRGAAFDSSFWVHAVYLGLVDYLLEDYELICPRAVEKELGRANPTSLRLRSLLEKKRVQRGVPRGQKIKLYGDGEREAINLALERRLVLLIDDWRPYEAAQLAGAEVVNSVAYLVRLYEQGRVTLEKALGGLGRVAQRGTLRQEWIQLALKMVYEVHKKRGES